MDELVLTTLETGDGETLHLLTELAKKNNTVRTASASIVAECYNDPQFRWLANRFTNLIVASNATNNLSPLKPDERDQSVNLTTYAANIGLMIPGKVFDSYDAAYTTEMFTTLCRKARRLFHPDRCTRDNAEDLFNTYSAFKEAQDVEGLALLIQLHSVSDVVKGVLNLPGGVGELLRKRLSAQQHEEEKLSNSLGFRLCRLKAIGQFSIEKARDEVKRLLVGLRDIYLTKDYQAFLDANEETQ